MENQYPVYLDGVRSTLRTDIAQQQVYDMIVFCHLRWQFVYQRPQHIISRLSKNLKILMVEEPIGFNESNHFTADIQIVNPNLHILQPHVDHISEISNVLPKYVANKSIKIGWFYSAAFMPVLKNLNFDTVVYDCMDELSLFKGAPQSLIDLEKELLEKADIVFTGGKSLYAAKEQLHDNVFCFPSSVDQKHFAQALNGIDVAPDIANIASPIVGYYGVIDERINLELLKETAEMLPEVSFVMIGPLAKINDQDLPHLSNIYYLGMKTYEELPAYLKAFDIAMMPFALNDATKFISPTKTLEYMAAEKPIISTRIVDVERDYAHCVDIVEDAEEFCNAIINWKLRGFNKQEEYQTILNNTSWQKTAEKMQSIIKNFQR